MCKKQCIIQFLIKSLFINKLTIHRLDIKKQVFLTSWLLNNTCFLFL